MDHAQLKQSVSLLTFGVVFCASLAISRPCSADRKWSTDSIVKGLVHELVGVNGYWFTASSAQAVLGTPKFASDTTIYVKPAHRYNMLVTGGVELIGANDHWQPFSGGNQFSLNGASFKISGEPKRDRIVPFISGGGFIGHIRSERTAFAGFRTTQFVPSVALGADLKTLRYITFTARYRFTGYIRGVNTDGFFLGFKVF
jgi:hypothetical protein